MSQGGDAFTLSTRHILRCVRIVQTCLICCVKCTRYDLLHLDAFCMPKNQPSLMQRLKMWHFSCSHCSKFCKAEFDSAKGKQVLFLMMKLFLTPLFSLPAPIELLCHGQPFSALVMTTNISCSQPATLLGILQGRVRFCQRQVGSYCFFMMKLLLKPLFSLPTAIELLCHGLNVHLLVPLS